MKKSHEVITVTRPYLPNLDTFKGMVDEIWANRWLTNQGPLHQKFEKAIADIFDESQITLTVNGHMALDIMLKGLAITGEVITTPFTFASTAHAITMNGLTPVFCDVDENSLTLDPNQIESLITEKTSAILPVHVYGFPCDVSRIDVIAKKHKLKVLYDAAHTFGCRLNGKALATYGDVSMLSFHATKLFHSIEGGALVYGDTSYKCLFDAYKNFGIEGEEKIDYIGLNAKMNEFQAAMGLCVLTDLPDILHERAAITKRYRERLTDVSGIRMFRADEIPNYEYNYAYLPVLFDSQKFGKSRDDVYVQLKKNGVFSRKYFYPLVTEFGCYANQFSPKDTPIAHKAASQILCLPIYNGLGLNDVDRICDVICSR